MRIGEPEGERRDTHQHERDEGDVAPGERDSLQRGLGALQQRQGEQIADTQIDT